MSNNQVVIETLKTKRMQLLADQKRVHYEYQQQIDEIEDALDILSGKIRLIFSEQRKVSNNLKINQND